ncbi:MAG: hypothetical protein US71_C0013G0012 [Parcubacteria group bacterium GW2011_GWD2_38_12]|nr:MAG: hypothetical protein US06_C0012G0007 [Parcubacteria group bacterium GW2011_GWC2_36_17]KKQ39216.1 MAG: hypothetical protein US56_C0022G0002 [Candidatus Moranbacteria bacterium GW2011_GWF2_37_7]KKQ43105.1 MAG: hypothetical protein US61_C0016G0011 [Parcubacteria group bacterium GW2011_GWE2_37_8]KKQ51344.1 MAG: hypothetical protein US71_C0013G0012 [Parcubacteria group bacterium GW2011_GWD2_38_12]KKQ58771.1 MAG: hypothetical protein US79_C0003G0072 [Parcubacteria group bacterium GW2011_GWC1_
MIILSENEHIISVSRRHWWILAEKLIAVLFLFFVPVVIYSSWGFLVNQSIVSQEISELINPFLFLVISLFYTFLWFYFCLLFVDYYLDVWIITNMRILDIEQKSLFNREVSECYLSKIQDVTVETKGILPTFLNYGDLHVQTAAEKREFLFREIDNPNKIKNIILEQYNKQQLTVNQ